MTLRDYARERTALLLRRLAFRMNRAASLHDAESIHDLRVSIRRFEQCLLVFRQFFPHGQTKKMHRRLGKIMKLSGEIRNRDIAVQLLNNAGAAGEEAFAARLLREARQYRAELARLLGRWGKRDLSRRWGSKLGV